ncbi:MAG TPA: TPM domain-containing protein, partial [Thermoanaerobaculia bacterium]|nr:TPM domain-containing protein [Thermoanaerobaculia bacterium]
MRRRAGWAILLLAAQREVPFLSGRVVDEAAIVPDDVEARVEQKLAAWEEERGSQVAVLTVSSLEGDAVESFSLRVVEAWKLGRAEVDDGVLFLVAVDDRRMRIEVGYGLEPELTDLESGRILDEIVGPRFRQGDFGGGVEAGIDAILASLAGAELPPPEDGGHASGMPLAGRVIGLLVFALVIGTFSFAALGTPGGGGWFLYLFLVPFYLIFPIFLIHPFAGPLAAGTWLIGYPLLRTVFQKRKWGDRFLTSGSSRRLHRGG